LNQLSRIFTLAVLLACTLSFSLFAQVTEPAAQEVTAEVLPDIATEPGTEPGTEPAAEMTAEAAAPVDPLPGLEAFVDGIVEDSMNVHKGLPGVTVSVVKDGEIVLLKGYGFADVEKKIPVDPKTSMFRIGSISKTFTGLAVMQLVEQGKLDLDADINTYLTDFKIPDTFPEPITLGALLSHRAGFEDAALGILFQQDPAKYVPLADFVKNHLPARVRPVGQTSTYTNYGIALAGYIVQVVSGQDYADYVDEHIFKPLGMNHSSVREPLGADNPASISPELAALIATGYSKGPDGKPLAQPVDLVGAVGPSGSISSTAGDMARYMMARLDDERYEGGRLVSEETAARMRQRLYHDRPGVVDMAHAMGDNVVNGYQWRWHNGGTTTFFSDMTLYPDLQLGIFVSTNSSDGGGELSGRLPRLVFERYYPAKEDATPPKPPADFVQRGQKYAGTFMMTRRSYTTLEKITALQSGSTFTVDADGYLVQSIIGQTFKWVEVAPGKFENASNDRSGYGATQYLYFYDNADGEAVRATLPVSDLERVAWWQSPPAFFMAVGIALLLSLTILLGGWRRSGDKSTSRKRIAVWPGRVAVLAALSILVIVVCVGVATASIASNPVGLLFNWPPGGLRLALWLILLLALLTFGMVVLLPRTWSRSGGWGWFRKLHYTAFTLACVFLLLTFNNWNMIGFKY
jgi:CubicO group peptidase (beta-lactamase class C family)